MREFSIEGGPQNVGGVRFFEARNDILQLGKALKFGVIFQKYAFNQLNYESLLRKFEKMKSFSEIF